MPWGLSTGKRSHQWDSPKRVREDYIEKNFDEIVRISKFALSISNPGDGLCKELCKVRHVPAQKPVDLIVYMKRRVSMWHPTSLLLDGIPVGVWFVKKLEDTRVEAQKMFPGDFAKQVRYMKFFFEVLEDIIMTNDIAPLP